MTHPLLDALTTYGTLLLWPLSQRRFAFDAVAIIDPAYTLILLTALICTRVRKLSACAKSRIALVGLVLSTAYLLLGYSQSRRAVRLASQQLVRPLDANHTIRAVPSLFNVWLWRVIQQQPDGDLRIGYVSTVSPRPITFTSLRKPQHTLVDEALNAPEGRLFSWFAMGLISVDVTRSQQETRVRLSDQRYGLVTRPTDSPFNVVAIFDRQGQLISFRRIDTALDVSVDQELKAMWSLITGP